jgi:uncharacterized protein YndB with AHSA1/START domain
MENPDFKLQLDYAVPATRLFEALSTSKGLHNWWTTDCDIDESLNGQSTFRFAGHEVSKVLKTIRLDAPRHLEWLCIDCHFGPGFGYADPRNWVGTQMRFDVIDLANGHSRLDFTHTRLNELECRDNCHRGWNFFLDDSLRAYLETGVGKAYDVRIAVAA